MLLDNPIHFGGGIKSAPNKTQSLKLPIEKVLVPPLLTLPLRQHVGAPAVPVVAVGERVLKGQLIASDNGIISASVHASSSGTIVEIDNHPVPSPSGADAPCILIETDKLREIGGFEALHGAIIDDCTLARLVKRAGGRTWIGLSRDVRAVRPYESLENIWNMVARSAFTQLRYSTLLLVLCSVLLLVSFVVPILALVSGSGMVKLAAITALAAMGLSYAPTIQYYGLPGFWVLSLPIAACLLLLMTWTSAVRYWGGERTRWKNRSYEKAAVD